MSLPGALELGVTLHILASVVVAGGAGAAFAVALQGRTAGPAVGLNRALQQNRLGRMLQWGLIASAVTGFWLVWVLGASVLLNLWLLLKLVLLVAVGALTGALQARTQKRRLRVLTQQASGDGDPALAGELAECNRRENLYFGIVLPAVALLLLLGIIKPF